jgi:hypothetical protein
VIQDPATSPRHNSGKSAVEIAPVWVPPSSSLSVQIRVAPNSLPVMLQSKPMRDPGAAATGGNNARQRRTSSRRISASSAAGSFTGAPIAASSASLVARLKTFSSPR